MASLAIWAVAAGSAVHWALQLGNPAQSPVQVPASGFTAAADAKQMARLLGHSDAINPVSVVSAQTSRYDLLGVVQGGPQGGAAIISVDGKPARTVLVGRQVGEVGRAMRLTRVSARSAVLTPQQGEPVVLQMQPLDGAQAAATSPAVLRPDLGAPANPPAVPMPEGPSEGEGSSVQPVNSAAASTKPGVMRLRSAESPGHTPAAALRQPGAALSSAAVFGLNPGDR